MKIRSSLFRIVLDIVLVLCIFEGWWFVAMPVAIMGAWIYPFYIEIFIAGIVYDSLFGFLAGSGFKSYSGTIVSVILIIIVAGSKRVMRKRV